MITTYFPIVNELEILVPFHWTTSMWFLKNNNDFTTFVDFSKYAQM